MKKSRILILVVVVVAVALLIAIRQAHVSAQQTMTVKVTPGNVDRILLIRVNPGQRPAFDQDVMTNTIPVYEEEKKAGILAGYQLFNNVTTENPNDWTVAIVLTYPNFATLDNLGERTDPITLKHYGSVAKRQEAANHRNQIATVVSSRLIRAIHYGEGAPGSN
jgi:hypothetical protein